MATKRKNKKAKIRVILFLPICLILLGAIFVTIGSYWVKIFEKYQEKNILEQEIVALKEKEEQLKVEVDRLEDPDYVARFAREKYMYSKDGEIILRLPEE